MPRASSKRPPPPYWLDVSDDNRKPVPTLGDNDPTRATYVITPLGHVYRDDGRLLTPFAHLNHLKLQFCRRRRRSLPKLVFLAFGHPRLIERWHDRDDLGSYDPWVDSRGRLDPLTGRPSCSVYDVWLIPRRELVDLGARGRLVRTRLSILKLP
jgi:hypothetical protein